MAAKKQMSQGFLKGVGVFALILALVISVICFKSFQEVNQFTTDGIKTTATITKVTETKKNKEASRNIVLHLNFFTEKSNSPSEQVGDLITTEVTGFGYHEKWYHSKTAEIYYLKSDPKQAIIESQYGNYNLIFAGLAMILLFLFMAIVVFRKAKKG